MSNQGTMTHHHAVGRDHAPLFNSKELPPTVAAALRSVREYLDTSLVLNPGVLLTLTARSLCIVSSNLWS